MNSAVALGKLGANTHFLGRLSRDAFGRQLRQHILEANVKLDLATESSQATSIAVVSLDEQGVASYTFHFNETANFGWQIDDLPDLPEDDLLHIESLSCIVSPGAEVLLDWMRDIKSGVSYDINVRPTVITASPSPYCSTHVLATSTGSPPSCPPLASALARNLMSSSLALTIPCRRPTTRSQG